MCVNVNLEKNCCMSETVFYTKNITKYIINVSI
jgi:hypothetical protein